MELGEVGLLEVDLGDIEYTNGEQEEYWLLAIKAVWVSPMLAEVQNQTTW